MAIIEILKKKVNLTNIKNYLKIWKNKTD